MSEEEIIERLSERIQDSEDVDRIQVFLTNDITAIQGLLDLYKKEKEENGKLRVELEQEKEKNKELEKYDYRKIKFDDRNKIKSPSFTKEQLELMNLGICLYVALPKILADEENEDEEEI